MKCKHCSNDSEDGNFCLQTQECSVCMERIHSPVNQALTVRFFSTSEAEKFVDSIKHSFNYERVVLRSSNYVTVQDRRYSVDQSGTLLDLARDLYLTGKIDYMCIFTMKAHSLGGTHV